ncbi:hypothetical protein QUF72_10465 [Desulfobacterales bacterium HSG2]|nr:hypothetical protein [Desulfobacterales bacterium HSG2]
MKLEFEQKIVSDDLTEELDFKGFLSLFDIKLPLLPRKILHPMNQEEGTSHFKRLCDFQARIEQGELDIERLIAQSRKLPLLDSLMPFFKDRSLEQFHLYSLGRFVSENQRFTELEANCPLAPELNESCAGIQAILENEMKNGFSALRHTSEERTISEQIETLEQQLRAELTRYENDIYAETGLRMIYPYPKETDSQNENLSKILNCKLLSVTDRQNVRLIDFRLPISVETMITEKDALAQSFGQLMEKKLERINKKLGPLSDEFSVYYEKRKQRVYYYALLWVKNRYSFCLPEFQAEFGCKIRQAALPCLKNQIREYVPLNLDLDQGSNLLFGANMTGKTTVLKTLYFHLTAIRMGLPVPAEAVRLHFPGQVEINLRTSGDIRKNLSSFGEEIQFFTRDISPSAYVLADELFQSTDPVSGAELSGIFLSEFSGKEALFFCTSHYPEVLRVPDISLFRMKDAAFEQGAASNLTFEDLLSRIPYQLERILPDTIDEALKESRKPLYVALHFPLAESAKEKIRLKLG